MQIKSIAETDFLNMINMLTHSSNPEHKLILQGQLVALVDMHVREQIYEVESRRLAVIGERRHSVTTKH